MPDLAETKASAWLLCNVWHCKPGAHWRQQKQTLTINMDMQPLSSILHLWVTSLMSSEFFFMVVYVFQAMQHHVQRLLE